MNPDISLRRIERIAIVVCAAATIVALAVPRGGQHAALSVIGGGVLAFVSYWSIKHSTRRLIESAPQRRGGAAFALKLAGRYALLAFLAYVMIARLRLHPLGLLMGASSVVVAVFIEAIRLQVNKS